MTYRRLAAVFVAIVLVGGARSAKAVCTGTACHLSDLPASCCGATSCTLDGAITISGQGCDLDFGARNVTLTGSVNLPSAGASMLAIEAATFTISGSGSINGRATAPNPGSNVVITTTGHAATAVSLAGGASSGIDLSGFRGTGTTARGGGTLMIHADGDVSLSGGSITAAGLEPSAIGGTVSIDSKSGNLAVGIPIVVSSGTDAFSQGIFIDIPGNVTLGAGSRLDARGGFIEGGTIGMDVSGTLTIAVGALLRADGGPALSAGTGGSIDISAGSIHSDGTVDVDGATDVTGDAGGDAGSISLEANTGALVVATSMISADGAAGGGGGDIQLTTDSPVNGTITIDTPVSASGFGGGQNARPAAGGSVSVSAANGLSITSSISARGAGAGGGDIEFSAGRDIHVTNVIEGDDALGGGTLDIEAGHDVLIEKTGTAKSVDFRGTKGGAGGEIDITAGNDVTITRYQVDASGTSSQSLGSGPGGDVSIIAGRNFLLSANGGTISTDARGTAGAEAGSVTIVAGFAFPEQTGDLEVDGDVTANGHRTGAPVPGSITLRGCRVTVAGSVDSQGDTGSFNELTGRSRIVVSGSVRASGKNTAISPTGGAPTSVSGVVSPPFTVVTQRACTPADPPNAVCLMPCPTCGNGTPEFPEQCEPGPNGCTTHCDAHCRTLDCNDDDACSTDSCSTEPAGTVHGAVCFNEPIPNGTSCADGSVCNGQETCSEGVCIPGIRLDCDDHNPCTDDTCDPGLGCRHANIIGPGEGDCDDRCVETCANGTCTAITPPNCDDGKPETNDACNPATGTCVHSTGKTCTSGTQCDDGNPCTDDQCTLGTCRNTERPDGTSCDDATVCNGRETCQNGACTPGTPPACNDNKLCTDDRCDPTLGCPLPHPAVPNCCEADVDCRENPDNPCTIDRCIDHACTHTIDTTCCTVDADCNDANSCTADSCNAGHCQHANVGNGTSCGTVCNPASCQGGTCQAQGAVPCPDEPDVCTLDFCDAVMGCVHQPIDNCCHDAGECEDHDACTTDVCTDENRCRHDVLFPGCKTCRVDTDCNPDGACGGTICDASGVCQDHAAPDCTDGNIRTRDVCVVDGPGQAHCEHPCLPGVCDDHNACNGTEGCSAGTCVPGTPLDCDRGDPCFDYGCDPASGCTSTPKTGFASARCRFDAMEAALAASGPGDVSASVSGKLHALIAKSRAKLAAAESAGGGKRALKSLKAVGKQLATIGKVVKKAQKKHKVGDALAAALTTAAQGASQALESLKS